MRSVDKPPNMVRGMNLGRIFRPISTLVCKACTEGKQYAIKWGNDAERQTTRQLEIMHLGVYGPMRNLSLRGGEFLVTFVDDFSRKVWVYMINCK